jgi:hypothetical protein
MLISGRTAPARRAARAGLVVLALSAAVAVLVPATAAGAAGPRRADIAITGMTANPGKVISGDQVIVAVDVSNIGRAVADIVFVQVTPPAELTPSSTKAMGENWSCEFYAVNWDCQIATLAPGQPPVLLQLPNTVTGGAPGDVLTVTATASTPSRELSTANNAGQASVEYVQPGTIRGRMWEDVDHDGQRDPEEWPLSTAASGIYRLWLWEGALNTGTSIDVAVDADGNYSVPVKPGQYMAMVGVRPDQWDYTAPNIGDEATDSDVVGQPVAPEDSERYGYSQMTEVAGGSELVIDIGLINVAQG